MGYLDNLKIVTSTKPSNQPPEQHRRNKLILKLDEQILCARAKLDNKEFYVERTKTVTNEVGERIKLAHQKRVNPWWYRNIEGKLVLEIRYANKKIDLLKGKTGIEVENIETLIPALELLKKAIEFGELDNSISLVAKTIRKENTK